MKNTSDAKLWLWTIHGTNGEHAGWQPTAEKAKKAADRRLKELGRTEPYVWYAGDTDMITWDRIDVERIGNANARHATTGQAVAMIWKEGRTGSQS